MPSRDEKNLAKIAELACEHARKRGAQQAAAKASLQHGYKVVIRDGKQEEVKASVSRSLTLDLYVDSRYGSHSTSVLEPAALAQFIDRAIDMTRLLTPDPNRALPDPKHYAGRSRADLKLLDPAHADVAMSERQQRARLAHDAAREKTGDKLLSAGAGAGDGYQLSLLRTTNGFSDQQESSSFWVWATVSVKDPSGRRPSDWSEAGARRRRDVGDPAKVGREAAELTLSSIGADKIKSVTLPIIVWNRAAGRLLGGLLAPLFGQAIDQKRSCFENSLGQKIAVPRLSIVDDPLLPGGWGSRRYDGEGISGRRMPIVENGVLKGLYLDAYYARKLKREPTTGGSSNLVFSDGKDDLDALCRRAAKAVLVTSFLGGNSNSTTGDFSHGIGGFLIERGERARPIASMNIAGNHKEFWKGLDALGNDPYPYSGTRSPSLLFAPTVIAGR